MRHARETILALAPEGFNISLSSCFNYTQNYKQGTYQAKRHHSGRGINACLSLHKPPRTGVEQFVVNLHWSTQNVNLTMDYAHLHPKSIMVDSKDAKAKVNADVSPVQKPGKTWRKITLPDHDWDRLAHNSITPMSHLFLETHLNFEGEENEEHYYGVRRTGTAATLLNLSYLESETVHRVFNEILLLLVNPVLDKLFQNPDTGKLKEHFVFIVDNGPSEAPFNPLVRMWLVRLARLLQLKSVTQKSFAEYHSKRNPVERVHASQNHALSNEIFSSTAVHQEYKIGDQRHLENMGHMAGEVQKCLARTQFGGRPCLALRGIGSEDNFVFNDEEQLVTFLGKSECRKNEDDVHYQPVHNELWKEVTTIWNLNEHFVGSYREDYQTIQNSLAEEGGTTCWTDKYSTTVFNPDLQEEGDKEIFTAQPIPDYVRWVKTGGELHYFPLQKVEKLQTEVVDNTPGAFLPSKILEMACKVFSHGLDTILPSIAFLSWCTEEDVKRFFVEFKEKLDKKFMDEKEKEFWCKSDLYKQNGKAALQELCRKNGISSEGKKHECVLRIMEKSGEEQPPSIDAYDGNLISVPESITEIRKLSGYRLREILRYHNVLDCGTKDELALRVGMLRAGRSYLAFHKELEAIFDMITATKTLVRLQKEMYFEDPKIIHKRRKYSTPLTPSVSTSRPRDNASISNKRKKAFLSVPEFITLDVLEQVLEPLESEIGLYQQTNTAHVNKLDSLELEAIKSVGASILALWHKDEIGDTGWKTGKEKLLILKYVSCMFSHISLYIHIYRKDLIQMLYLIIIYSCFIGWYKATVLKYFEGTDTIEVEFDTEKGVTYKYSVGKAVKGNRMKLAKDTRRRINDYGEICQIGATVEINWLEDELSDTDWPAGIIIVILYVGIYQQLYPN